MPQRPRRLRHRRPPLSVDQILAWADEEHRRRGRWPHCKDAEVLADTNEKWVNIDAALRMGFRGLPGGSSLPQLLDQCRGVRNVGDLPELTEEFILAWAQAHHGRTGDWPSTL